MDEVNELIPIIAKGVSAKTCREMATEVIEICKVLAPLMYEAFKMSQHDVEIMKAIEKTIRDLIGAMIENGLSNVTGISEQHEQQGTGELSSVFGESDLVITLPDDQYDELMKNQGENQDGKGIKVRREHPKESEDKKDDSKGSGSGESKSQEEEESSEDSQSEGSNNIQSEDKQSAEKEAASFDTSQNDSAKDAVEKAMQEAADRTDVAAEKAVSDINTSIAHEKRSAGKKEVTDKDPVVSAEEMKDICDNFIEVKRKYEVKTKMPAVLEARCRAMYRKNKRYFKSLSTPNVSHLDSGSVDPSLIYGLSFGDTEIFRKQTL